MVIYNKVYILHLVKCNYYSLGEVKMSMNDNKEKIHRCKKIND